MFELTKNQKIAIAQLAQSDVRDMFYWTGGTLLSVYYFQHRLSYDLDFFSERRFSFGQIDQLAQQIKKEARFRDMTYRKVFDRYEFMYTNGETLRIEFVWYNHDKKTLRPRKKLLGIQIDSLEDIAANKLISLMDRSETKDLLDLYYILTKGKFSAKKIISLTKKKFGMNILEYTFWGECFRALPKLEKLMPMLVGSDQQKKRELERVEQFFRAKSRGYLNSIFDE